MYESERVLEAGVALAEPFPAVSAGATAAVPEEASSFAACVHAAHSLLVLAYAHVSRSTRDPHSKSMSNPLCSLRQFIRFDRLCFMFNPPVP